MRGWIWNRSAHPLDDVVGELRKHGSTRICDLTRLPDVPESTPANKARGVCVPKRGATTCSWMQSTYGVPRR